MKYFTFIVKLVELRDFVLHGKREKLNTLRNVQRVIMVAFSGLVIVVIVFASIRVGHVHGLDTALAERIETSSSVLHNLQEEAPMGGVTPLPKHRLT